MRKIAVFLLIVLMVSTTQPLQADEPEVQITITDLGNHDNQPFAVTFDVAINDSIIYSADADGGLNIIDATDPYNPILIGTFNYGIGNYAKDFTQVIYNENYVYLWGVGMPNVYIVNVTDPTNPTLSGMYEDMTDKLSISEADRLFVKDNYLYCVDRGVGVHIVDISDKTNPTQVSIYQNDDTVHAVHVNGDYLFLDKWGQLEIVDISDKTSPTQVFLSTTLYGSITSIKVIDDVLYMTSLTLGFSILDVSDKSNPLSLSDLDTSYSLDLKIENDVAYVPTSSREVHVVDISDTGNPSIISTIDLDNDEVKNVEIEGNMLVLAKMRRGISVYDLSDPTDPQLQGKFDLPTVDAIDIIENGDYIYALSQLDTVRVWKRGDDNIPVFQFDLESGTRVYEMVIHNNILALTYLAEYKVSLFDISDPTNIVSLKNITYSGQLKAPWLTDDYLLVSSYATTIVVDMNNDSYPIMNEIDLPIYGNSPRTRLYGDVMIVEGYYEMHIFDASNISEPVFQKNITTGLVRDWVYQDGYLYTVENMDYLMAIRDISDVNDIKKTYEESYSTSDAYTCVDIHDNMLFLANSKGVRIVNITDHYQPDYFQNITYYSIKTRSITATNNSIYVTMSGDGWSMWDYKINIIKDEPIEDTTTTTTSTTSDEDSTPPADSSTTPTEGINYPWYGLVSIPVLLINKIRKKKN